MTKPVVYQREREVAVITVDNPPVSALSPGVPEGLASAIEQANADAGVRATW